MGDEPHSSAPAVFLMHIRLSQNGVQLGKEFEVVLIPCTSHFSSFVMEGMKFGRCCWGDLMSNCDAFAANIYRSLCVPVVLGMHVYGGKSDIKMDVISWIMLSFMRVAGAAFIQASEENSINFCFMFYG